MPPKNKKRWIYFSPHFDDAVLSCGGWIWEQTRQGTPVAVWTVCAGDPPPGPLSPLALDCHTQWGTSTAEETVALRRAEDRNATGLVGAAARHFTTPDCIYRRSPQGGLLYAESVFVPRHRLEGDLHEKIAAVLAKEIRPDDTLVCPLAIAGHLDHLLTRAAVENLGRPLRYYADIPYLFYHPEELEAATSGMRAGRFPVSEAGLLAWLAGIAAYATQIGMLFESGAKMQEAMRGYWESQGALRLWHTG